MKNILLHATALAALAFAVGLLFGETSDERSVMSTAELAKWPKPLPSSIPDTVVDLHAPRDESKPWFVDGWYVGGARVNRLDPITEGFPYRYSARDSVLLGDWKMHRAEVHLEYWHQVGPEPEIFKEMREGVKKHSK